MAIAVGICFCKNSKVQWFDPAGLELSKNEQVVVETGAGQELGEVKVAPGEVLDVRLPQPLKPITRRATVEDQRRVHENKLKEQQSFRTAVEKIAQYNLPMKLVSVECAFDRSKMIFHFVAENRVDFRELAKDLARTVRSRVELHQIGVRDEAKIIGGLGPCGQELCCAAFLANFEPVGIKMAKEQDLSLNPQKISGVCGRLMCCLAYEYPCYKKVKQRLPKVGSRINTPKGVGRVTQIDVTREEVIVELEEGGKTRLASGEIVPYELPAQPGCEACGREETPDENGAKENPGAE